MYSVASIRLAYLLAVLHPPPIIYLTKAKKKKKKAVWGLALAHPLSFVESGGPQNRKKSSNDEHFSKYYFFCTRALTPH